ncbi:TRDC protein, partial [Upupa epops]|nr:TRDC protein [Upupa epops]
VKSKKPKEDGNIQTAACLARKSPTKGIDLQMSSDEVLYKPSSPILAPEGVYSTIKVVHVAKDAEVACSAKFDRSPTIVNKTLPGTEEPVTGKVCNITDIPASLQDTKVEKVNMLSMAVLGLRVLLAKSIAFNTLMSVKLLLF